jgi:pimeloyl-ACP methyl ester carboxylesterase
VNPFFLGSSDKQLFGVHHPPEGVEVRDGAVLLCPSLGHEYIAGHASLTQLGQHLARQGLHVLRFDFYGCGDSAGDIEDASVEQWVEDVGTALQELRDTSGSRRVSVVGLRLGASIAALAAAGMQKGGRPEIHASVLWEPVVCGTQYLHGLAKLENRWLGAMYLRPPRDLEGCDGPEVMGHLMPEPIREELRRIDLENLPARPAEKILLMQNNDDDHLTGLHERLSASSNGVAHEVMLSSTAWFGEHWATVVIPPVVVLRRIAEWVRSAYS